MPSATGYYYIKPRYTEGSMSSVARSIAYRVADEETKAYMRALTGAHGDPQKANAECMGLRGICELRIERGYGKSHRFEIHDLCTGEWLTIPTGEQLNKQGYRHYSELGERVQRVIDESPPQGLGDWHQAWFRVQDGHHLAYYPQPVPKV
jgi:hypothetical protein